MSGQTFPLRGLRRLREAADLSQFDLARRAGLSRSLIANAEKGYVPAEDSTRRIARGLGCTVEELRRV